ncbi:hypothetical protein [Nocardia salmonicida]|uniref:hypothetical protein n=1 Tax=Nocardia salmonicida TaxID=53431 RepID=UPI0033F73682
MPENTNEPILPIPSDLDQQTWDTRNALQSVCRQVIELQKGYRVLHSSPESLRTDELGQPMDAHEATNAALMWLESSARALSAAQDGMRRAGSYTTRLSLTDQASEDREQRLEAQTTQTGRRRPGERTR